MNNRHKIRGSLPFENLNPPQLEPATVTNIIPPIYMSIAIGETFAKYLRLCDFHVDARIVDNMVYRLNR